MSVDTPEERTAGLPDLPQYDETWEVKQVHIAHVPVAPFGDAPWAVVVVEPRSQGIVHIGLSEFVPTGDQVAEIVVKGCCSPKLGPPRLPTRMLTDDLSTMRELRRQFGSLGVEVLHRDNLEAADEAISSLMDFQPYSDTRVHYGILDLDLSAFFQAARSFAVLRPWNLLESSDLLEIDSDQNAATRIGSVMGAAGDTFGFALFDTAGDAAQLFAEADRSGPAGANAVALIFNERDKVGDLADLARRSGWPIMDKHHFPVPIASGREPGPVEDQAKVDELTVALMAVLALVKSEKRALREGHAIDTTVSVALPQEGERSIRMKWDGRTAG